MRSLRAPRFTAPTAIVIWLATSVAAEEILFDFESTHSGFNIDTYTPEPEPEPPQPRADGTYPWYVHRGYTISIGTGPNTGFGGQGNYVYTEASNRNPGYTFKLEYDGQACGNRGIESLSFRYHMLDSGIGSLTLYKLPVLEAVWHRDEASGAAWKLGSAMLNAESFAFEATTGNTYQADTALVRLQIGLRSVSSAGVGAIEEYGGVVVWTRVHSTRVVGLGGGVTVIGSCATRAEVHAPYFRRTTSRSFVREYRRSRPFHQPPHRLRTHLTPLLHRLRHARLLVPRWDAPAPLVPVVRFVL